MSSHGPVVKSRNFPGIVLHMWTTCPEEWWRLVCVLSRGLLCRLALRWLPGPQTLLLLLSRLRWQSHFEVTVRLLNEHLSWPLRSLWCSRFTLFASLPESDKFLFISPGLFAAPRSRQKQCPWKLLRRLSILPHVLSCIFQKLLLNNNNSRRVTIGEIHREWRDLYLSRDSPLNCNCQIDFLTNCQICL